jgi:hypothetical protein
LRQRPLFQGGDALLVGFDLVIKKMAFCADELEVSIGAHQRRLN